MQELAQFFAKIDRFFNIVGYIPIVSTLTGAIRAIWGQIQAIIGAIAMAVFMVIATVARIAQDKSFSKKSVHNTQSGFRIVANGFLNTVRGTVEAVPILGNLLAFLYDWTLGGEPLLPYLAK